MLASVVPVELDGPGTLEEVGEVVGSPSGTVVELGPLEELVVVHGTLVVAGTVVVPWYAEDVDVVLVGVLVVVLLVEPARALDEDEEEDEVAMPGVVASGLQAVVVVAGRSVVVPVDAELGETGEAADAAGAHAREAHAAAIEARPTQGKTLRTVLRP